LRVLLGVRGGCPVASIARGPEHAPKCGDLPSVHDGKWHNLAATVSADLDVRLFLDSAELGGPAPVRLQ
ncbi:unnamed protein product, partial [Polarella glacialis]